MCIEFSQFFTQYAWPRPVLISNEEAIERFCPLELTGVYRVSKDGLQKYPNSANQLQHMLTHIRLCPCKKAECKARLLMLEKLQKQCELIQEFSDKLISEVLMQPLSDEQHVYYKQARPSTSSEDHT